MLQLWCLCITLCVAIASAQPDLSCLRTCLASKSTPSTFSDNSNWAKLASPFNLRLQYKPAVVVSADTVSHVSEGVKCASSCGGFKVQARSGGHSYASFSTGGQNGSVIIDLASLNTVTVHANKSATIEGGVRLGNLDLSLFDAGKRAISHGTCAGVGIGGHSTHGGYGYDSRAWGLALDHIEALEVVLADGSVQRVSAKQNEDVYWAARGAADSIAIVTKFHMRTQAAPEKLVYWSYDLSNCMSKKATFVAAFQHVQSFALNTTVQDRRLNWGMWLGTDSWSIQGKFFGTLTDWKTRIEPELLRTLPKPAGSDVREVSWLKAQALFEGSEDTAALAKPKEPGTYTEHDTFYTKSLTVPDPLSAEALGNWYTYATTAGAQITSPNQWSCDFDLYGGPDSQVSIYNSTWSAFQPRNALWTLQMSAGVEGNRAFDKKLISFVNGISTAITSKMPNTKFAAYHNYVDPELSPAEAHRLYFGSEVYERLLAIKKRVDPNGVFQNPLSVGVGDA
ncbi:FAD-binding domain-containing protein [Pseudovirgaria hyperparasitica]|uniref:FAD-binding domain-containing protein n=1 Tax=Pseudovirgaria hyperparasitica TaxID=470096 RepID=A0A6A6WAT8_9PEZI|nr:FAD-binding domain-containing protein [Pseudovirgaria hyperparasitica]KAF2759070.1 FAD-binding domain-containing protein [Pseudovirgaria hyperparasitica]